jgi:sirohydrochlorin cobaltochelatase
MMPSPDASTALLVVGHGTRSDTGTRQFLELAQKLAQRVAPMPVEPCFLELQQPDIAAAVGTLVKDGVRRLTVVPLLLFAAGHAKRDIPAGVEAAVAARWHDAGGTGSSPAVEIRQARHLGCHHLLVELSRRRFVQAVAGLPPVPPDETCLLLVGRGSRDESATAEMHRFAELRHQADLAAVTEVGFLAMARPSLAEILPRIAAQSWRRVVVQPQLLFEGELADNLRQSVAQIAAGHPAQQWLVAPLLADPPGECGDATERLVDVLLDRIPKA